MPFNGSGVYVRLYSWVNDAAANIKIRADRMDAETNAIATGLSNCITKDGQTTVTANLPMGGFKHTNVANASSNNEYAAFGQIATAINAITFDNLSDVTITGSATGDFIVWNGTAWTNRAKASVPLDGVQATGATGVLIKNSGGTTVATVGASNTTATTFAGNTTVQGLLAINGITYATGSLEVGGTASSPAFIKLAEDTDNGTNKVTIIAPASIASDYTLTLPATAGTIALLSDIPTTSRFISTAQTITPAGSLTIAHGLGSNPVEFGAYLTCTTADAGYSIGARVPYYPMAQGNSSATSNSGVTINSDATNLNIRFGQSVSPSTIFINHATTGNLTGIANSSWTITFIAKT